MEKTTLWTKDFTINTLANFLLFLGYYMLMVIIAGYAMDHLQATPGEAGLVSGIFIVAALVSRLLTGSVIERIGRKKMLYGGLLIYAAATLLYFAADTMQLLYLVRIVQGIGFGVMTTSALTIIVHTIPKERQGEGISYFMMSVTLASALGPFIGMNLYQYASFQTILIICVALLVVVAIAVVFLKVPEAQMDRNHSAEMNRFSLHNIFEVRVLPLAMIGAMAFFSYSSVISFLSPYSKDIGLASAGSYFFIVYSAVILISRPITGRWFDAKGENFVLYPAFVLFAIGLLVLSQARHGAVMLVAAVFLGFGFGTFGACAQAVAIKLSPEHRKGLATSTYLAIAEMGIGFGPFLLGLLIPAIGYRWVYVTMAAVVMLALLLYYVIHGRLQGKRAA